MDLDLTSLCGRQQQPSPNLWRTRLLSGAPQVVLLGGNDALPRAGPSGLSREAVKRCPAGINFLPCIVPV